MTLVIETSPNTFDFFRGQPIDNIVWSPNIENVWTQEELEEKGLYVVFDPGIPAGKTFTDRTVARIDGVVQYVYTLVDPGLPGLTMRQLRLGLVAAGLGGDYIQTIINSLTEPDKTVAQIWYEETSFVEYEHTMTQTLLALTGIPTEQIEAMWLAASQIPA